jgi:ClpP class serine protease
LLEKLSLNMETVKNGEVKDPGNLSHKLPKNETQLLQNMIEDMNQQFIEAILDFRGDKLAQALAAEK